jgi:hypothetical protein
MKLLFENEIEVENLKIYLSLFKLYKSYLFLISDNGDYGIGSITMATPIYIEDLKTNSKSYKIFGVQKELLSQIIAEKVSTFLNAPVLLILFFKDLKDERVITKPLIKYINQMLLDSKEIR